MRKIFISILVLFVMSAILKADEGEKYGKSITLKEKTKISDILKDPESFVGKKVLVEGTVVNVCEKRGCWMELSSDEGYGTIRVKVEDGEIVFPMEAKGKTALVEGEIYSFVMKDPECTGEHAEGENADKKCEHESNDKCETIYQIKGIGAVIN
jgi:hypothetical protein